MEGIKKFGHRKYVSILLAATFLVAAVGNVSATVNFSEIVSLIEETNTLWTPLMDMVIGVAPLIITFAIIGFLGGLIAVILHKVRSGM